jgi:dTDP-4-amino-4,6-dideoxygalactose transaminase
LAAQTITLLEYDTETETDMSKKQIPQFDPRRQYAALQNVIEPAIAEVLKSGWYINGPAVREFETAFAQYLESPIGIGCASGTDALKLAIRALGIGPGDEVITTPLTFIATIGMIVETGATPVFVDIDPVTFNMNPELVGAAITDRTKAILAVHLYGQCADVGRLMEFGPPVIEDAAQAAGAEDFGHKAGSLGRIACFSFYPTKNLGGCGEGGFVTTNDTVLGDLCRKLLCHGMTDGANAQTPGFNARFDTVQAAALLQKLPYLDEWNNRRRTIAGQYAKLLQDTPVITPTEREGARHVYHQYVIRTDRRDALGDWLTERGVGTARHYKRVAYLHDGFKFLGHAPGLCPEAERATRDTLCLPMFPELTDDEVQYVAEQICAFYSA